MKEIAIKHKNYHLPGVCHQSRFKPAKGTVVISHGFRGSKEGGGRARVLAEQISRHFDVIRYDFTPLGTLTNQVEELTSVLAYAKEQLGGRLILLGRSMGGCASLLAAAQRKDISGLLLWSMPFDTKATFTLSLGEKNIEQLRAGREISLADEWGQAVLRPSFYNDLISHDLPQALLSLSGLPVLFVHGEFDEIVPLPHAQQAFAVCAGEKAFALIAGGDHRFINGFEHSSQAVVQLLEEKF